MNNKLTRIRAQLAESADAEERLRKRVKALIMPAGDQARDWGEAEMRTTVGRLTGEMMDEAGTELRKVRTTIERRDAAFDEKVIDTMNDAVDTIRRVSGLLADNARLAAELEASRVTAETLGAKLITLSADECGQRIDPVAGTGSAEGNLRPQQSSGDLRPRSSLSVDDYNSSPGDRTSTTSSCLSSIVVGSADSFNIDRQRSRSRSVELISLCLWQTCRGNSKTRAGMISAGWTLTPSIIYIYSKCDSNYFRNKYHNFL